MGRMKYPIGIQDFESLRRDGYVYVDKTRQVYDLASTGRYYFLGRPRRFGKSLLISTMKAYFKGKRKLFEGLALEQLEKEWTEYPVLHLDLNSGKYDSVEALVDELNKHLEKWEAIYGDKYKDRRPNERFYQVIELAYRKTGRHVAILIDEYDKPLLQTFDKPKLQDELRAELKAFYSVLKTQDRYIRLAFLTGVTKFGKVSVFSDLNNLKDISMDKRYADICGITEEEIHQYFESSIHELAEANGMTYNKACDKLKDEYDGYHFRQGSHGIYNPFSLLNTFDMQEFKDYWFETGTPTFLLEALQKSDYDLSQLPTEKVKAYDLGNVNSFDDNPVPLLYQSGYLTIKDYNSEFNTYHLGFPNKEVEKGFIEYLLPRYMPVREKKSEFDIENFVAELRTGKANDFMHRLQTFYEASNYKVAGKAELYFQNTMFIFFRLLGFYTEVEYPTARGRADIVVKTRNYIYIFECKLDGSADEALRQIDEKGYAKPFEGDPRKLFKIGVNFSSKQRSIAEWKI